MIKVIILFCLLALGLALGPELAGNKGYILIALDNYTIELSVTSGIFLGLLAYVIVTAILWAVAKLKGQVFHSKSWWKRRRFDKSSKQSQQGQMALLRGDYHQAEKLALASAGNSSSPNASYLLAAQAAAAQGQDNKSQKYLEKAAKHKQDSSAVLITQAQIDIQAKRYSAAMMAIDQVDQNTRKLPHCQQLLAQLLPKLQRWEDYLKLLDADKKLQVFDASTQQQQRELAYQGLFQQWFKTKGTEGALSLWNQFPRKAKQQKGVTPLFCEALIKAGDSVAAYQMIGDKLNSKQASEYFALCSQLKLEDFHPLMQQLLKLKAKHSNNPQLFIAIAEIEMQQKQYSEAIAHLELSSQIESSVRCNQLLGDAHFQLNEGKQAAVYYRLALQ